MLKPSVYFWQYFLLLFLVLNVRKPIPFKGNNNDQNRSFSKSQPPKTRFFPSFSFLSSLLFLLCCVIDRRYPNNDKGEFLHMAKLGVALVLCVLLSVSLAAPLFPTFSDDGWEVVSFINYLLFFLNYCAVFITILY